MIRFYSGIDTALWKKKSRFSRAFALFIPVTAWMICTLMCFFVNTQNATLLFTVVLCSSVFSGWCSMILFYLLYRPAAAEYKHSESLICIQAKVYEGSIFVSHEMFQIPKGITVTHVLLKCPNGEEEKFTINARFIRFLPSDGTHVLLETARNYITGFEALP